jgi:hypothetical protein
MPDRTTSSTDRGSSYPALIFTYRSGPNDAEYSCALQRAGQTGALTGPIRRLRPHRPFARLVAAVATIEVQIAAPIAFAASASAQTRHVPRPLIGSPNSSRKRPPASPFRQAGYVL